MLIDDANTVQLRGSFFSILCRKNLQQAAQSKAFAPMINVRSALIKPLRASLISGRVSITTSSLLLNCKVDL